MEHQIRRRFRRQQRKIIKERSIYYTNFIQNISLFLPLPLSLSLSLSLSFPRLDSRLDDGKMVSMGVLSNRQSSMRNWENESRSHCCWCCSCRSAAQKTLNQLKKTLNPVFPGCFISIKLITTTPSSTTSSSSSSLSSFCEWVCVYVCE